MKKQFTLLIFLLLGIYLIAQPPAPDFDVLDAHGNRHRLYADYLDQGKTVVLKLFFVNCPPCNQIAPATETLYQDWGGNNNPDVEFFSVTIQSNDNNSDVIGYENLHSLTYPGISADGGAIALAAEYRNGVYGPFSGTPTFVVIAPNGEVNFDVFGPGNSATIMAVDQAIQDSRSMSIPDKTITIEIDDAIQGSMNFDFSIENDQQSYAPDVGTTNAFTVPTGSDYTIEAEPISISRSGISTFDLVLISKHITGLDPLNDPKKLIAADVNNTESVSTFDVIELRKYLLFISQEFPDNEHWVTIPSNFNFTDNTNPWLDDFQIKSVEDLQQDLTYQINPIRIGDVNGSSWDNLNPENAEVRSTETVKLLTNDQNLFAGETYDISIQAKEFEDLLGFQFSLQIDTELATLENLTPSAKSKLQASNFNVKDNQVLLSWHDLKGLQLDDGEEFIQLRLSVEQNTTLSQVLSLGDHVLKGEAYPEDNSGIQRVELQFQTNKTNYTKNNFRIHPNPMYTQATIQYELANSGFVQLEILSLTGRLVKSITSQSQSAGTYRLPIDKMESGMYFVRMIVDGELQSTKRLAVF